MAAATPGKRRKGPTTVVREYLDALSEQDLDRAVALWKPGAIDNLHGIAEMRAPEGIREYFAELFRAFPDFRLEVVEVAASGELAAARWRTSATFSGPGRFQGLAPTGARVEFEGAGFLQVTDELIVANHAYTNALHTAQQLGILPPAGSPAEKAMAGAFNAKTAASAAIRKLRSR